MLDVTSHREGVSDAPEPPSSATLAIARCVVPAAARGAARPRPRAAARRGSSTRRRSGRSGATRSSTSRSRRATSATPASTSRSSPGSAPTTRVSSPPGQIDYPARRRRRATRRARVRRLPDPRRRRHQPGDAGGDRDSRRLGHLHAEGSRGQDARRHCPRSIVASCFPFYAKKAGIDASKVNIVPATPQTLPVAARHRHGGRDRPVHGRRCRSLQKAAAAEAGADAEVLPVPPGPARERDRDDRRPDRGRTRHEVRRFTQALLKGAQLRRATTPASRATSCRSTCRWPIRSRPRRSSAS